MGANCLESYSDFEKRMKDAGYRVRRFRIRDPSNPKSFKDALHNWYDPMFHELSKEFHPEHREEVWYKEKY